MNLRFAADVGSDLSFKVYKSTLYQPYKIHIQRNSSEVIATITAEVGQCVTAINAFLQLFTSLIVALALFGGMLIVDWKV